MSTEDLQKIVDPFGEQYGLDVEIADLDSSEIAQRVATEQEAGKTQADVIQLGGRTNSWRQSRGCLRPSRRPTPGRRPDEGLSTRT